MIPIFCADCGHADRDRAEEAGDRRLFGSDRAARTQGAVCEGGGGGAAQRFPGSQSRDPALHGLVGRPRTGGQVRRVAAARRGEAGGSLT